jgi:hypothetical protein
MSVYHRDDDVTVHHGDCLTVLKTLADNSIDAICTEPPQTHPNRIRLRGHTMTSCLSRFLRTPCCRPNGHPGNHIAADSSGHITVWTDLAADTKEKTPQ